LLQALPLVFLMEYVVDVAILSVLINSSWHFKGFFIGSFDIGLGMPPHGAQRYGHVELRGF